MTAGWIELEREITEYSPIPWRVGEPVVGEPEPYASGATSYADLAGHIANIGTMFSDYTESDNPQFQGSAARAFNRLTETIAEQLIWIPGIADQVSKILSDHEAGLVRLHVDADLALASAWTNWHKYEESQFELRAAQADLDDQVLDLAPSEDHQRLFDAQDRHRAASSELLNSLDQAQDLVNGESILETTTSDGLRDVNLGAMADPGFWDKVGGALWDLVLEIPIIGEAVALVEAFLDGDWDRFWWRLRDLLDDILYVAAVIGTVLFVVSLFLTAPIAFPALVVGFLVGAAVARLAIDFYLFNDQIEDPDNPGRTMTGADLALSAFATVGAVAGVFGNWGALGPAVRGVSQGFSAGEDAFTVGFGIVPFVEQAQDARDAALSPSIETEIQERTDDLDAAVDDQMRQLDQGASPNEVFAVPPQSVGTPAHSGAESEAEGD